MPTKKRKYCAPALQRQQPRQLYVYALITTKIRNTIMRIRNQFLLTLIGASLLILLVTSVLMQLSFQRSLDNYLSQRQQALLTELASEFSEYYDHYGSFDGITLRTLIWNAESSGQAPIPPDLVLIDATRAPIFGPAIAIDDLTLRAINVSDETVGWLGLPNNPEARADIEHRFVRKQRNFLLSIAAATLFLTFIGAWWLSRKLVKPIEAIAAFSRTLGDGEFIQRLSGTFLREQKSDELKQLSSSMNSLANSLEQGHSSRQRWLADLSHELRTPVTIMRAELEAMQDGVRPLDQHQISAILSETLHLTKLLDDLHDLSLADAGALRYRMEAINLNDIVRASCSSYESQFLAKQQQLLCNTPSTPIIFHGDAVRLRQLLDNLLRNSLKYTDNGTKVNISLQQHADQISLSIKDESPGVSDEQLAHLFDHLYRVENSRNRHTGGAGLGLAICQRIVEAHQGTIEAHHHHAGETCGLAIEIHFNRTTNSLPTQPPSPNVSPLGEKL